MTERHKQHLSRYLSSHKTGKTASQRGSLVSHPSAGTDQPGPSTSKHSATKKSASVSDKAGTRSTAVQQDVPVLFTTSTRTRASFLAARRRVPMKVVGTAGINHLPDELLLEIFSYLGVGHLLTAARVCRRWQVLANDNLLWESIFEKYGTYAAASGASSGERPSIAHCKSIYIKQCTDKRNKKAVRFLKKTSPFTGLPRDTDKALRSAGVYFHLGLVDHHQNEHVLVSSDIFYHQMAVCVRWYDLEMPSIKSIREVRVYAVNPLFFEASGSAVPNSPYQRSLLKCCDLDWNKWLRTNPGTGGDDMIILHTLPDGLTIATWKNDGEFAFVCQGLHSNQLVKKCLYGTAKEPYNLGQHKVIFDDIDSSYGLHGYQCTVEIRTLRNSIWSQQFNSLCCKKENIGSGYATFPLIRRDYHCDHVILQKKLQFPWKTDAFKGIVENVVWVDVTVHDERSECFWNISSCVRIGALRRENNFDFDYSGEDMVVMSYTDKVGKIEAHMSQTDSKDYFMTQMDLKISLDAINSWFGTSY